MKIMERRYKCRNGVVERTRFAVGDRVQPRAGKRKGATSVRQQERNLNTAVRRLARIMNNNYGTECLLVTLDYSEEGLQKLLERMEPGQRRILQKMRSPIGAVGTWGSVERIREQGSELGEEIREALDALMEKAEHQAKLWLRRVDRKIPHKAVWITADLDGETGELVRVHHHIPLCPEAGQEVSWDFLRKQWKLGGVDIKSFRTGDYTPLAIYLMKQVRHKADRKKYGCSRGFELPVPEERIVLSAHNEIRTPAGAKVLERQYSEEHVGQYVRYLPRTKTKQGGGADGIPEDPGNRRVLR